MTDTSPPAITRPPGAGPVLWVGLLVVLAAAAALSFDALRDLAEAVGIPPRLTPLLPIAIDAGSAVSCATWLSGRVDEATSAFARRMTFGLLALTVIGNAAQVGMHAHAVAPPWWVAVAVGAIPPVVVGATVHLAVLVSKARRQTTPPARVVVDAGLRARAERLVAAGAGRPRVADELGLTDHQARRLVQEIHRPSDRQVDGGLTTSSNTRRPRKANRGTTSASYPSLTPSETATDQGRRQMRRGDRGGDRERQARARPEAVGEG